MKGQLTAASQGVKSEYQDLELTAAPPKLAGELVGVQA